MIKTATILMQTLTSPNTEACGTQLSSFQQQLASINSQIGQANQWLNANPAPPTIAGSQSSVYGATNIPRSNNLFNSIDTHIAEILPTSLKPYAKYAPYIIGGLAILSFTKRRKGG